MKKFGEEFKEYKSLGIEHFAISDTGSKKEEKFYKDYKLDKNLFPEIRPPLFYLTLHRREPSKFRVIRKSDLSRKLKKELDEIVIRVAPTSHVYPILSEKQDLEEKIKMTFSNFKYYVAELGLNVMMGKKSKICELLFKVDLISESISRTAVTAYDIAPDDKFRHIQIIKGKISLGVTKLLKFLPHPVGQAIPNLLNIDINPWEFDLGFNKYEIEATGELDYKIYWKIYEKNIVRNFNPIIIIKARKEINKLFAKVRCIYKLKTSMFNADIKSTDTDIKILPM